MGKRKIGAPIQRVKKKKKEEVQEVPKFGLQDLLNIYEFETTLPGSGEKVKFRPLTTGQLKGLIMYQDETNPLVLSKVMNELIQDVVISPDFDIEDQYLKDREYLLMQIKGKSKGAELQTTYVCKECKSQNLVKADLNDLPIKKMPKDVNDKLEISEGVFLELDFMCVEDEQEAFKRVNKAKDIEKQKTELAIAMIASSIISVQHGDKIIKDIPIEEKIAFIENMPTHVYESIGTWHDANLFGLDTKIKHECIGCKNETTLDVSSSNFFL